MEVVIVGAGKVGESLAADLIREGYQVTLIDKNPDVVLAMSEKLDLKALAGNGTVPAIQMDADVPDCDVFIAATPLDEVNIVACIVASRLGARHCVARIRNPEYTRGMDFGWDRIGIDHMMNADREAAREIIEEFDFTDANYVEPFTIRDVKIVKLTVESDSKLAGLKVRQVRQLEPRILLCSLERDNRVWLPQADDELAAGDFIYVIGEKESLDSMLSLAGHKTKSVRSAFITGGGLTARYLLPALLKRGIYVKLVERDRQTAESLALEFPRADIVVGDGTEQGFLLDQRLERHDVSIALTNIDEENIMFSLYAARLGVKKTITKVSRVKLVDLLDSHSLDAVITPHLSVANELIRYVRSLRLTTDSELEDYHRLDDGKTEAIVFLVKGGSAAAGIPFSRIRLKPNILIGLILRGDRVIIPGGNDALETDDRVIIIAMDATIRTLDDILEFSS